MRRTFISFAAVALFVASGCSKYDDSALTGRVENLEGRVERLEKLCEQMNADIASLQTLVEALQSNDYVTGVVPVVSGGETVGYTINFTKSGSITIYHGEDGQDGAPGEDGSDGYTPQIGIRQDTDGIFYWTLDGEWLTDDGGDKIKAQGQDGQPGQDGQDGEDGQPGQDGADGVTPQLKIEDGYWYISYNGGSSWEQLGKATGEDGIDGTNGQDGDSFFRSVDTSNSEYVVFTLADGTEIKLPTWYAFEQLRTLCNQMNTNIASLQSIVEALQNNDYIVSCTPLMEDSVQVGYTITFAKSGSIVIYHGRDGVDGHSPQIGAKRDSDGVVYWTLDGEWLTDDSGSKIPVHGRDGQDGTDGVTPQLKIEDGYWYISYNGGGSWEQLGKATGEDGVDGADGQDGDAFFSDVSQDEDYVYLTLSGGERIEVPKHHPLSVSFSETEDIRVLPNKTYTIDYTITGADENTVIKALAQDGFRAVVKETDFSKGVIEITTPETVLSTEILVFVTDGKERTIMRSINFVEGVIIVTTKSYTVGYNGGTVTVELSTNIDYTVEIPEADRAWISVGEARPRAVMRDEALTFTVQPNNNTAYRYSTISLVDNLGVTGETILITQKSGTSQTVHLFSAGTLDRMISAEDRDIIEELKITGTLNVFDFEFIKTMSNLKALDLSEADNTTLPASCLAESDIPTVLLPLGLTAIHDRAFYQAAITSIYIPDTVETIGEYAFSKTASLRGNIVIPDSTVSVGGHAFEDSPFDGTLTLGSGLQSIGEYAFAGCGATGDLTIPDSVTELGDNAFRHCVGFTGNLTIGNGVAVIPDYAFYDCRNFKGNIIIGDNVTEIGTYAFAQCYSLTGNLVIPDKVAIIEAYAFSQCVGFQGYLVIGSNVQTIGVWAFVIYNSNTFITGKNGDPLFFSKIYCKAIVPPTLDCEVSSSYNNEWITLLYPFGGIIYKKEIIGGYTQYSLDEVLFPEYLIVPKGTIAIYEEQGNNHVSYPLNRDIYPWRRFEIIDDIDF